MLLCLEDWKPLLFSRSIGWKCWSIKRSYNMMWNKAILCFDCHQAWMALNIFNVNGIKQKRDKLNERITTESLKRQTSPSKMNRKEHLLWKLHLRFHRNVSTWCINKSERTPQCGITEWEKGLSCQWTYLFQWKQIKHIRKSVHKSHLGPMN